MKVPANHSDLSGKTFGYVIAIKPVGYTSQGRLKWLCRCKCANTCVRQAPQLTKKTPGIVSCGCRSHQKRGGKRDFKAYAIWRGIIYRCRNKKDTAYSGRGIRVCTRWRIFENFLKDMGERPDGMCIERIDNNSGYSPNNCRWATTKEQTRNYRRNVYITVGNTTKCVADWANQYGLPAKRIYARLSLGWSGIDALMRPKSIHHSRRSDSTAPGAMTMSVTHSIPNAIRQP